MIDFASLSSVRKCAADIKASYPEIDILVNNAGLENVGEEQSEDGIFLLNQTNYYGPVLFTELLLGKLFWNISWSSSLTCELFNRIIFKLEYYSLIVG